MNNQIWLCRMMGWMQETMICWCRISTGWKKQNSDVSQSHLGSLVITAVTGDGKRCAVFTERIQIRGARGFSEFEDPRLRTRGKRVD